VPFPQQELIKVISQEEVIKTIGTNTTNHHMAVLHPGNTDKTLHTQEVVDSRDRILRIQVADMGVLLLRDMEVKDMGLHRVIINHLLKVMVGQDMARDLLLLNNNGNRDHRLQASIRDSIHHSNHLMVEVAGTLVRAMVVDIRSEWKTTLELCRWVLSFGWMVMCVVWGSG
jgi:hypothetical protein